MTTAIITSCIRPREKVAGQLRSFVSAEERETQTIHTISRLIEVGFQRIILADNSDQFDFSTIRAGFASKLEVVHIQQYQFLNKGINEVLLLLAVLKELPDDTAIFKISGRYYPDENFNPEPVAGADFIVKGFGFERATGTISTRAYFVKNKAVYEDFLVKCLEEMLTYPFRAHGIKSILKFIGEYLRLYRRKKMNIPVELAAARVLKQGDHSFRLVATIGITGILAGLPGPEFIRE